MTKIYRIHEFAKRIGKSPGTLRRWDKKGILIAERHPSGHRYYNESDKSHYLLKEKWLKTYL